MNQQILITPEQIQQLLALTQSLAGMSASAAPQTAAPAAPEISAAAHAGTTPVDAPAQPVAAETHTPEVRERFSPIYQGAPKPKVKAKAPDYAIGVLSSTARQFSVIALWPLIVVALVLSGLVYWYAPAKILVIAYGIAKLALFAVAGTLIDYLLFPDDAPEALHGIEQGTAWKRRAWIVCAAIVAGGLLR